MNVPPPRFTLQDSQTIPNLDTRLVRDDCVEITCPFALLANDFINVYMFNKKPGGYHSQAYAVAQDAARLVARIDKARVEANSGDEVQLQVVISRNLVAMTSPLTTITINKNPIVIPTPGYHWDFLGGNLDGWVPQGPYTGGKLHVVNGSVAVDVPASQVAQAHIITRAVRVVAGRTYDCSFEVRGGTAGGDGSTLYMTMNGSRIGSDVQNITNGSTQTGTGSFAASSDGTVHLGIFNNSIPSKDHLLFIGNIRMTPRP